MAVFLGVFSLILHGLGFGRVRTSAFPADHWLPTGCPLVIYWLTGVGFGLLFPLSACRRWLLGFLWVGWLPPALGGCWAGLTCGLVVCLVGWVWGGVMVCWVGVGCLLFSLWVAGGRVPCCAALCSPLHPSDTNGYPCAAFDGPLHPHNTLYSPIAPCGAS